MYFEWKESYSVNVAEIDIQHKKMFEIGGRIVDLLLAKDGYDHYDEIITILQELADYTVYHFGFEEELLEQYGYKELDSQKIEHTFFIKKLEKFRKKDIDADQKSVSTDLVAFVSDWITSHILTADFKYRDHLNGKGLR